MTQPWREALVELFSARRLSEALPLEELPRSASLIHVDGDQLYAWCRSTKEVLTVNLKTIVGGVLTSSQKVTQSLRADSDIDFDVTGIELSPSGFHLLAHGTHDLVLLQLPKRFGRHADFDGGAEVCTCVTRPLGLESGSEIRSVKWHPDDGSLVAVLTSDNLLRLFDVNEPDGEPVQVFILGDDASSSQGADSSRLSANVALGDIAIDFDFGSRSLLARKDEEGENSAFSTEAWPIFVLRENGDVFLLITGADHALSQFSSRLRGPLTMSPPADDNYGVDACSILCLETTPPIIAICTREGKVYHAVPLESELDESLLDEPLTIPKLTLFVYEAVELELTFNLPIPDAEAAADDVIECVIQLRQDPSIADRYYCCHQAGVHAVSLPWANNVEAYLKELTADEAEVTGEPAVVEHLVCTQPLPSVPPRPLRGVGVTRGALLGAPTIICLCHDDSLLTVPLNPTVQTRPHGLLSLAPSIPSASPLKKLEAEPIEKHLRSLLLRRNASNPILKAAGDSAQSMTQQQFLQILVRATQGLREEYLLRQVQAREELKRRVDLLRESKGNQLSQLDELETTSKEDLREKLEQLADKLNTAQETQEDLTARADAVIKKLQSQLPVLSRAESEMKTELVSIEQRLNVLKGSVEQAKIKRRYQLEQKNNIQKTMDGGPEASSLSVTQVTSVKGLLSDQGRSLHELIANIKTAKQDLD